MVASVNEFLPNEPMKETSIQSHSTPAREAMALANSTSFTCFCPYTKLKATTFLKCFLAQNKQVVES